MVGLTLTSPVKILKTPKRNRNHRLDLSLPHHDAELRSVAFLRIVVLVSSQITDMRRAAGEKSQRTHEDSRQAGPGEKKTEEGRRGGEAPRRTSSSAARDDARQHSPEQLPCAGRRRPPARWRCAPPESRHNVERSRRLPRNEINAAMPNVLFRHIC